MSLSLDTSRCTGLNCPKKYECKRFIDRPVGKVFLNMFCPKSCIVKLESGDSVEFKYKMIIKG